MIQRQIGILGAGAMGTLFGGSLARLGHNVMFFDVDREVVARINAHGVAVEGVHTFSTTDVRAVTPPALQTSPYDVVFVFVKGMHTRQAISVTRASGTWSHETIVITVQNGWGNPDTLCNEGVDPEQLVVGVTNHAATLLSPGRVALTATGPTLLGAWSESSAGVRRAHEVAEVLRETGWQVDVRRNIRSEIWKKLVLNSAVLPVAALTTLPCAGLVENDHMRALLISVMRETIAVGQALGFDLHEDERIAFVCDVLKRAGEGKPSMLQDLLAGRPSEIETINGAVITQAEKVGLPVPANETLYRLVRGAESARHS